MAVSMYSISVPIFVQHLSALSSVIDKAAAFAQAKKVDQAFFLTMRLAPDMYPFAIQIEQATKHAVRASSLLSDTAPLDLPGKDATFDDLKARIAKTVDYLTAIKPEQIAGTDDKVLTLKFSSGERTYTGQTLLLNFILPNFYFHCTTAYDILRHCGLELVKRDFMGTPMKV